MDKNDERQKGEETPKGGAKDLDSLRARLGLKDTKGPAGAKDAAVAPGAGTAAADPEKISTDDFKLDFGAKGSAMTSMSIEEVDSGKVTRPKGRFFIMLIVSVVALGAASASKPAEIIMKSGSNARRAGKILSL